MITPEYSSLLFLRMQIEIWLGRLTPSMLCTPCRSSQSCIKLMVGSQYKEIAPEGGKKRHTAVFCFRPSQTLISCGFALLKVDCLLNYCMMIMGLPLSRVWLSGYLRR